MLAIAAAALRTTLGSAASSSSALAATTATRTAAWSTTEFFRPLHQRRLTCLHICDSAILLAVSQSLEFFLQLVEFVIG
jgi:hypothetical protein